MIRRSFLGSLATLPFVGSLLGSAGKVKSECEFQHYFEQGNVLVLDSKDLRYEFVTFNLNAATRKKIVDMKTEDILNKTGTHRPLGENEPPLFLFRDNDFQGNNVPGKLELCEQQFLLQSITAKGKNHIPQ